MFFIQCTQPDLIGKWLSYKQKYLIYFQSLCKPPVWLKWYLHTVTGTCKPPVWLKWYLHTVTDTPTSSFYTETFGWTGYTFKYQIIPKKNADIEHVNNLRPLKFRTSAENDKEQISYFNYNKKAELLINFWSLENKYLQIDISFSIVNLTDKLNKFEDNYNKIQWEIREFSNDRVPFKHKFREVDNGTANRPRATEITEEMAMVLEKKNTTNHQKFQIPFKIITLLTKKFVLSLIQLQGSNHEISYQIFYVLISTTKKIFVI